MAGKVAVSRSNHPHIDLDRVGASESFKFLLLYRAQQFRLQFQGDVSDFIEKERAPIRQLESPLFLHQGAGERTPLVSEEFALQQASRNRCAIDLHQIVVAPRAEFVNRRAISSFPVPVSPEIKTVALVGATISTCERTARKPPCRPTIVSRNEARARPGASVPDSSAIGNTAGYSIEISETRCRCAHLAPSKTDRNDRSLHGSVIAVAAAGNPTSVVRRHYIGLGRALCRGSMGPFLREERTQNGGERLTLSVRKLDAPPSKQAERQPTKPRVPGGPGRHRESLRRYRSKDRQDGGRLSTTQGSPERFLPRGSTDRQVKVFLQLR